MLIVRGTMKLRDRLRSAPVAAEGHESTTLLGDWFATALFWKPQVVLLVNSRTMVPVFMRLAPAATILDRAPAAIAGVLREHGVPQDVIASELAAMSDVRLASTNDRQLVGVMNEFVVQAELLRARPGADLLTLSMVLSKLILGPLMKRHRTPADELSAMLGGNATVLAFPSSARAPAAARHAPSRVHQLKVTLRHTTPPIWRRIVVDGGQTLQHLHDVVQAAFGWYDSHLHQFEVDSDHYGIPDEDDWTPVRDERRVSIDQVIAAKQMSYTYDFGDNWEHDIVVEKTTEAGVVATVPDCIGGRGACPPEDCGGPYGYVDLLEILADPLHSEYQERVDWLEWLGADAIDPDAFDPGEFAQNLRVQQVARHHEL